MLIGYCRVSTLDQAAGFDHQLAELKSAGCEKIYAEKLSGATAEDRPELTQMLGFLRPGDVVFALSLDRLARDTKDLLTIKDKIAAAGATLKVRGLVDTADASSELVLTVLGAVATWERRRMLERQRIGIAAAKAEGRYKGRAPTARRQADKVRELAALGMKPGKIAKELHIGRSSVWRILTASGNGSASP